jgi:hypothetical protein
LGSRATRPTLKNAPKIRLPVFVGPFEPSDSNRGGTQMHQRRSPLLLVLAVAGGALWLAARAPHAAADGTAALPLAEGEKEAPPGKLPECVKVRTEARYSGLGYDHVVEIENTCEKAMSCTVATDVNTQSNTLKLAPKQLETVVTFRGSPAREFKADVSCKEQS